MTGAPLGRGPMGSTARGSTAHGSMTRRSTVRGSTACGSTVRGSTARRSMARGSTVRGSMTRGSTLRGSTVRVLVLGAALLGCGPARPSDACLDGYGGRVEAPRFLAAVVADAEEPSERRRRAAYALLDADRRDVDAGEVIGAAVGELPPRKARRTAEDRNRSARRRGG